MGPHAGCWTAWAVHREWDRTTGRKIKRDLGKVVHTIAKYEPVRILAPRGPALASCANVTVIDAPADDFWLRDIMPTFVFAARGLIGKLSRLTGILMAGVALPSVRRVPVTGLPERPPRSSVFPRVSVPFVAEGERSPVRSNVPEGRSKDV